jgi:HD-GYP domain-containing protein (c-di-GMP phosphodiesterase class II)
MAAVPSVLRSLNLANSELDRLLAGLGAYSDAAPGLCQIAREVARAVVRAPDVAIACVLLNQVAGRYAVRHCIDSAIVACVIADALGKPEAEVTTVAAAALTMNVGMMRQIESFQAKTAALSEEERAIVRRHPGESAELLRGAGVSDQEWLDCVLQHHENHDGSGYPDGRRQDEIAFIAKLVGMADRYCACVSARNYRRSMLPSLALAKLRSDAANDPELARQFSERLGDYPPGTLVRLANGETGVVSGSDGHTMLVHVLRDAGGAALSAVRRSDRPEFAIDAALPEDEAQLRFSMKSVWGELAVL